MYKVQYLIILIFSTSLCISSNTKNKSPYTITLDSLYTQFLHLNLPNVKGYSKHKIKEFVNQDALQKLKVKITNKRFLYIDGCDGDSVFEISYEGFSESISSEGYYYFFNGFKDDMVGLKIGVSSFEEVKKVLGKPMRSNDDVLTYACLDEVAMEVDADSQETYFESIFLFFKDKKLFAVKVLLPPSC